MLVLFFVALWFILRGDLFYILPCVILFFCFSVILALRLPRLGKRELILVLFERVIDWCLFEFVCFLSSFWEGLWFVIVALPGLFSYLFLPHLQKQTIYKARFNANAPVPFKNFINYQPLTIKTHVIRCCEKVYKSSGRNLFFFLSIKNLVRCLIN